MHEILGPPDHVPSARKLAAFQHATAGATGVPPLAELVERTRFSIEGGHAAAARLIARRHRDHLRERSARVGRDPGRAARASPFSL